MTEQERDALPPLPEPIIKESCPDGDYEGYTADQMHAYARAALAAKAVPAGWKLVPVEPTTGMLVAGNHCQPGDYSAKLVWQSMLEAADRSTELSYLRPLPQDVATPPAPAPEATRSQRLAEAGYTRRPSWKSLPKDGEDEPEATPAQAQQAAQVVALPDPPAFPVLASMAEQVRHAIDLHREGASTAQAIGVLEIVKQQLIQEQQ